MTYGKTKGGKPKIDFYHPYSAVHLPKRDSRRCWNNHIDKQFLKGPVFGKASLRKFGGSSMSVILAPNRNYQRGTATNNSSIPSLMKPLHDKDSYDNSKGKRCTPWCAGHLLNADLGGRGDEDRNLTPLTRVANKEMEWYEKKVKNWVYFCGSFMEKNKLEFNADKSLGVRYKVEVSDSAFGGAGSPSEYWHVASHLTISAGVVFMDMSYHGGIELPLTDNMINYFALQTEGHRFDDVEIHNRDEHLNVDV